MSVPLTKATPFTTDSTENQPVISRQQPQEGSQRKGLQLTVKRLYQLDLGGQSTQVPPGLPPRSATCLLGSSLTDTTGLDIG